MWYSITARDSYPDIHAINLDCYGARVKVDGDRDSEEEDLGLEKLERRREFKYMFEFLERQPAANLSITGPSKPRIHKGQGCLNVMSAESTIPLT